MAKNRHKSSGRGRGTHDGQKPDELHGLEVKPIFATPHTQDAKPGESKHFKIQLESKIPEAGGDDYDITIPLNPALVGACPASVHVKQGEDSFDFTLKAASGGATGKVNIEIRERVDKGVITVTLVVKS